MNHLVECFCLPRDGKICFGDRDLWLISCSGESLLNLTWRISIVHGMHTDASSEMGSGPTDVYI